MREFEVETGTCCLKIYYFCGRNILLVVHSYSRLLWPLLVDIILTSFYFHF